MKLPGGEFAIVDIVKSRDYCLTHSIREARSKNLGPEVYESSSSTIPDRRTHHSHSIPDS